MDIYGFRDDISNHFLAKQSKLEDSYVNIL